MVRFGLTMLFASVAVLCLLSALIFGFVDMVPQSTIFLVAMVAMSVVTDLSLNKLEGSHED